MAPQVLRRARASQSPLSRLQLRFRHKLALFFGLVSLLSTSTALGLIYEVTVRSTVSEFGQKLAAIAAIRTGLNYFLEKELATIEKSDNNTQA